MRLNQKTTFAEFQRKLQRLCDRFFLIFTYGSIACLTGSLLWLYFILDHSTDDPHPLARAFLYVAVEVGALFFFFSIVGLIHTFFAPRWTTRLFEMVTHNIMKAFILLSLLMAGMIIYSLTVR